MAVAHILMVGHDELLVNRGLVFEFELDGALRQALAGLWKGFSETISAGKVDIGVTGEAVFAAAIAGVGLVSRLGCADEEL